MFEIYGKAVFGFLGAIGVAIALVFESGPWDTLDTIHVAGVAASAFIVWLVPVHPRFASAKSVAFFVVMLVPVLTGVLGDGFSTADIVTLIVEIGAILGVKLAGAGSPTITGTVVGAGIHDEPIRSGVAA